MNGHVIQVGRDGAAHFFAGDDVLLALQARACAALRRRLASLTWISTVPVSLTLTAGDLPLLGIGVEGASEGDAASVAAAPLEGLGCVAGRSSTTFTTWPEWSLPARPALGQLIRARPIGINGRRGQKKEAGSDHPASHRSVIGRKVLRLLHFKAPKLADRFPAPADFIE